MRFRAVLGAKNEGRESKTARKMAQVKERGGGGEERKETPSPCPLFHFFGCSFISRAALVVNVCTKPRNPFLGLSLLRN